MNNVKNVCLIGAGRAGLIHARNFKTGIPNMKITAVADPSPEAAQAACKELELDKNFLDYHEALQDNDIDAVIIVSPTKYHCEIVTAAANAGKHILCEKPMAMNAQECDTMLCAAEKNRVKLQIGFMRRFDASFAAAKEAVDAGAIGDVVLVKSLTRGPSTPQPWMYDIAKSNGPLAEVNSHDIDTLRWFTGSEFEHVYAIAGNYRCRSIADEYPDFYDNVVMNAQFANGMQGVIDGAQGVGYGYDARVEILGTDGVIYLGSTGENGVVCANRSGNLVQAFTKSWRTLYSDAYLREDLHFAKCVLEDSQPMVTGLDGKRAVQVVEAGNRSITEKRIVFLDR